MGRLAQVVFFAIFTPAVIPTIGCSLVRHQAENGSEIKKPRQCFHLSLSSTITVLAFAESPMHFMHGLAVSRNGEASSQRQGDGQRFQKKL